MKKKKMYDYIDGLALAMSNRELVKHYDRLFEGNLRMCLDAIKCGNEKSLLKNNISIQEELKKFDDFFYEYIILNLPSGSFVTLN